MTAPRLAQLASPYQGNATASAATNAVRHGNARSPVLGNR
jgi:hypothetical protein